MLHIVNVADLPDPGDSEGRTYRELNNAKVHKFAPEDLVQLDNGCRLFVVEQTRDCDGTPLYTLSPDTPDVLDDPGGEYITLCRGYNEDYLTLVQ